MAIAIAIASTLQYFLLCLPISGFVAVIEIQNVTVVPMVLTPLNDPVNHVNPAGSVE